MRKRHIAEPASAEKILTTLHVPKKMWKKIFLSNNSCMAVCKKCGGVFWPYYNFKETGQIEKLCITCKPERKGNIRE